MLYIIHAQKTENFLLAQQNIILLKKIMIIDYLQLNRVYMSFRENQE